MKILRLEILNLASLDRQGGEVINFEEGALGDSTIFSIVGPTGSGKSTLLDAICLALYGRAPRYPRKPGERKQGIVVYGEPDKDEANRPAPTDSVNILTRGKKAGYSKLTFQANNGNVYRAEWHVRFKSKKYGAPETWLYLLTQENGQPKEELAQWDDIPTIVGLDYDQFLRTVLIAQGSFANFLTAKEDERYQLLENLIGCKELYTNIASKIKEQKDLAAEAYNAINANFAAYEKDLIPDEELPALQLRIQELQEAEQAAKAELARVIESLGWYAGEQQFLDNLSRYATAFRNAQADIDAMKADIGLLKLHDSTLAAVECHREMQKAQQTISSQQRQLQSLADADRLQQEAIAAETRRLDVLKADALKAEKVLEEQKPHIDKARTIKGELSAAQQALNEKTAVRKEAHQACEKAKASLALNAKDIESARVRLRDAEKAYADLRAAVEEAKKLKVDAARMARERFEAEEADIKGLDASLLQEAYSRADRKKGHLAEAIQVCASIASHQEGISRNEAEISQLTLRNKAIDDEVSRHDTSALSREVETLQKSYTLMSSDNWERHRHDLQDGEACPLCGATSHPYHNDAAFAPVVSAMEQLIRQKKQRLEAEVQAMQQLSGEKNRNAGTITEKDNKLKGLRAELLKQQARWSAIHDNYPDWNADVQQLNTLLQHATLEAEKAGQALTDYNRRRKAVDRLRQEAEKAEKALRQYAEQADKDLLQADGKRNAALTALSTEEGKTANLKAQAEEKSQALARAAQNLELAHAAVSVKRDALKAEVGDNDPEALEQQLSKAKADADGSVASQTVKIQNLQDEQTRLKVQVETTTVNKKEAETLLADKTDQLHAWLRDYNASPDHPQPLSADDIARISQTDADWESIRRRQAEKTAAATAAKVTLDNEQKNHLAHQSKKPDADQATLAARKTALEQRSNAELVESLSRKHRHDEALRQLGTLHEEVRAKSLLKQEWEEILDAIGSDGKTLRKIAQCYTLRFLIAHANEEIRKFNSRYELQQVRNSLGIRVIDHDRADDVRDTTSLSGGETFIVSLGLALGLSALSSRNISFENLFIDEGFGTLDHDTLETVINSLAMLQSSQGKKVGVISHTETMSRITTQIRIIRNGSSGSSHIEIYP